MNPAQLEQIEKMEREDKEDVERAQGYDYNDVETIRHLIYGGTDVTLWDQVVDGCKVVQSENEPEFHEIMKRVMLLLTDEKQEFKNHDTCTPHLSYETYIAHFLLFTTKDYGYMKLKSKDPFGSVEFDVENYFEWACSKQFNVFATIIFNYAKKIKIELKTLDRLGDPCRNFKLLSPKLRSKMLVEYTYFINCNEDLGLEIDWDKSLMSAFHNKCYSMIIEHLNKDFTYDKATYASLIRMVSSNVNVSSTVDTRNMLPIFPILAAHLQKSEDFSQSHLNSMLSIGVSNGLKTIGMMESSLKFVYLVRKMLEFHFIPKDDLYQYCFRILQGLSKKANMDEFFALADSVLLHMGMSKSTLDLQPYIDNQDGLSTFLIENSEKYELGFQDESLAKRRRRD